MPAGTTRHWDDFAERSGASLWGAQADTLIPGAGSPLAWDRYAYTNDNPLRYTDPSGHLKCGTNKHIAGNDCSTWLSSNEIENLTKWYEYNELGNPVDRNGDGILGKSDIDWNKTWNLEEQGYDEDAAAVEYMTRAMLSEEGAKLGTDKHTDAVGVGWAIRNQQEDIEEYRGEYRGSWKLAATSGVHGMNSGLARDPMHNWGRVFASQYDAWRAYNLARDEALYILHADPKEDITRGAHYWTDAHCAGDCRFDENGRVTNPVPWERTHFRSEYTGQASWCVDPYTPCR